MGLRSLGLKSSWSKSLGLKGSGLNLGVEKSGVKMSFNLLKVLWKSSSKNLESIVFQKGSPLTPFFKNAYSKIRPTGTFYRLKQKWKQVGKSSKSCNANVLRPISFNKIVSLITILFCGICLMLLIISFEIALKSRQGKLEDNGDHSNIT